MSDIFDMEVQMKELKELRIELGKSRKDFAAEYGIPLRTVEDWEAGRRKMPEYVRRLLVYKAKMDNNLQSTTMNQEMSIRNGNINIISEVDGKKVVLINDIRFKSRRTLDWKEVEECLKEYIGKYYEIMETSEKVYIGTDFPDEFCHSEEKVRLKGANEKAKANLVTAVGDLIQIASNKSEYPDYEKKHKGRAKYGWYRYDTRFGIPVYSEEKELLCYNIFSARMLVRCDKDGKLYLCDFVRTKKETSSPPR